MEPPRDSIRLCSSGAEPQGYDCPEFLKRLRAQTRNQLWSEIREAVEGETEFTVCILPERESPVATVTRFEARAVVHLPPTKMREG